MRIFGLSLTTILILVFAFYMGTRFPNTFAKLTAAAS